MAESFAQLFREVIHKHGQNVCNEPLILNSLLADYSSGEYKRERHLLIWILKTGCINTLTADQNYETWCKDCAAKLNSDYYIDNDKALSMLDLIYNILLRVTYLQNRANYLFQSNEYEQADRIFDEILHSTPNSHFALLGKGNVAVKKQKYDDVIRYFEKTIELDQQKTPVLARSLGTAYLNEGVKAKNEQRYQFAIDCLEKAMVYNNENKDKVKSALAEAYYLQANCDFETGNYTAVISGITEAMQYAHDNETIVILLLKRAEANELLESYTNAISDYDKALGIDNINICIYEKRSRLYFKSKNYDYALHDCDTILKLDSRNVSAMYHKGIILEKTGDVFTARKIMQESLHFNPKPELRRKIDTLLGKINTKIAEDYESRGDKYFKANDYDNAYQEYSKAIDAVPSKSKLFKKRGDVLMLIKNKECAIADYKKAFVLWGGDVDFRTATAEKIFQKIIPDTDKEQRQTWEDDNEYRLSTIFPFKCPNCSNYDKDVSSCSVMQLKNIFALTPMNARCYNYVKKPGVVLDKDSSMNNIYT
ncbi:MAG: tetratricopeptide repeat protein [Spirochaetaceae bacterium]|jgi:tetratricopeptide (TPR) repeat protein|nr:tetratricopeptide repeat protein [Spirochaetaceae bacterium]